MSNATQTAMLPPSRKTRDLDCGIAPARIIGWLEKELFLDRNDAGAYLFEHNGQTCTAIATPLGKCGNGHFALERTRLVISGSDLAVDALMHLFTLRFLSAGG